MIKLIKVIVALTACLIAIGLISHCHFWYAGGNDALRAQALLNGISRKQFEQSYRGRIMRPTQYLDRIAKRCQGDTLFVQFGVAVLCVCFTCDGIIQESWIAPFD